MEFGFLLALAGSFVGIEPVGCQAEVGHLLAAGHDPDLGIAGKTSDQNDFIEIHRIKDLRSKIYEFDRLHL